MVSRKVALRESLLRACVDSTTPTARPGSSTASGAGYGDCFGHSFGHSLGLDIHEHPIAAPGAHAKLPEHTVISAEPGIYLPGKFGVRIEDVLHLTAEGAEILTRSPKNLIIL